MAFGCGGLEVVDVNAVEDVVLDGSCARGWGCAVDGNGGVDLLEGEAVEVELAVEDKVGWDYLSEDGGEMGNDRRVVEVVVSRLEFTVEIKTADAVELWLNEDRVGDFGLMVGELVGEHWFHKAASSGIVSGRGGVGLEKEVHVVVEFLAPRIW